MIGCQRCISCYFGSCAEAGSYAARKRFKPAVVCFSGEMVPALTTQPRHGPNRLWAAREARRLRPEARRQARERVKELLGTLDRGLLGTLDRGLLGTLDRGRKRTRDSRDSRDPSVPPMNKMRDHARARTTSPPPSGPRIVIFESPDQDTLEFVGEVAFGVPVPAAAPAEAPAAAPAEAPAAAPAKAPAAAPAKAPAAAQKQSSEMQALLDGRFFASLGLFGW